MVSFTFLLFVFLLIIYYCIRVNHQISSLLRSESQQAIHVPHLLPPTQIDPSLQVSDYIVANLLHVHVARSTPLLSPQGPGDEASTAIRSAAGELVQVSPTTLTIQLYFK